MLGCYQQSNKTINHTILNNVILNDSSHSLHISFYFHVDLWIKGPSKTNVEGDIAVI